MNVIITVVQSVLLKVRDRFQYLQFYLGLLEVYKIGYSDLPCDESRCSFTNIFLNRLNKRCKTARKKRVTVENTYLSTIPNYSEITLKEKKKMKLQNGKENERGDICKGTSSL